MGVVVSSTESNNLSNSESVNESEGLYDSDAEVLIRLIDGRNVVRLCKENITRDNIEESSAQIESTVAESESRSHRFNTRSKSRDKRHTIPMVLNNAATATGSSSSGVELNSPQGWKGIELLTRFQIYIKRKRILERVSEEALEAC